jgi:hypothetical protein
MDEREVDVFQVAPRHGRGLLILTAAIAIALSACSGGSATPSPAPAATSSDGSTPQPTAASTSTDASLGLSGAAAALANRNSFQFTMTVAGDNLSDTLATLPGAGNSGNGPFSLKGTFVLKPAEAADVTVTGALQIISLDGSDYQDPGITGSFTRTDATGLVDQLSPIAVFAEFNPNASGFTVVGTETKDGLDTDHYQAGKSALAELASIAGIDNATWTADVWIARNGGYPVAISVVAKAADNTIPYQLVFDLTKVDDPGNKVTAPTNVTGA